VDETLNTRLLKALGERIRELRSEKGYSQEAFADYCGVHRTFMGTVERGESNLSFQNIVKVATALNVTLSALFSGLEGRAENLAAKSKVPIVDKKHAVEKKRVSPKG
jgi:transcriptional regulator with XRE-family HTH domain